MSLLVSAALFAIFATNVAIGSFGGKPFLGDVGEMLLLLATTVTFVVAILKSEATRRQGNK